MLTWSLTRHPASITVPGLLKETRAESNQARSKALHTLSKIGDPRGWTAITRDLLQDPDDDVARSAWRAAVALVPEGSTAELAVRLSTPLGRRGDREVQLSLSRAMVALGTRHCQPWRTRPNTAMLTCVHTRSRPSVSYATLTRASTQQSSRRRSASSRWRRRTRNWPVDAKDDVIGAVRTVPTD
jgi:hypothetical protein